MDEIRAQIALREQIRQLLQEFGQERGWDIVRQAIEKNLAREGLNIYKKTHNYV